MATTYPSQFVCDVAPKLEPSPEWGRRRILGSPRTVWFAVVAAILIAFLSGTTTSAVAQPTPPEPDVGIQIEQLESVEESKDADEASPDATAPASTPSEPAKSDTTNTEGPDQRAEDEQKAATTDSEPKPTDPTDRAAETTVPATPATPDEDADAASREASEENSTAVTPSTAEERAGEDAGSDNPTGTTADVKTVADPEPAAPSKKLRVAVWSGAFGEAQKSVVLKRFSKEKSIDVAVVERNGRDTLILSDNAQANTFDAGLFSSLEIRDGCKSGRLARLENGAARAADDYLAGSLLDCGIGSFAWSHVFAANRDAFRKRKPKTLSDVFNQKRFPGKRALIKSSKFLLESALLADGAAGDEIYGLLATEEGRVRAFEKLSQIKSDILWVDTPAEAMELFKSGEAVFAQTFSGRAFFAAVHGSPVDVIWDGQIYSMSYWGISADAKNAELARDFVRFATEPQQLAGVAQRFPYGPTRTAALALSKRHLTAGIDLEPFLPTTPENLKTALELDQGWWRDNGSDVEADFKVWLEGNGE
ncbi:MAG: extracellular solute-binding protein [Filomicrobium sp.]